MTAEQLAGLTQALLLDRMEPTTEVPMRYEGEDETIVWATLEALGEGSDWWYLAFERVIDAPNYRQLRTLAGRARQWLLPCTLEVPTCGT